MNPISALYTTILIQPIFNILVGITDILPTHTIGWAIIIVTFLIRLILLPSSLHQARQASVTQEKMKKMNVHLEEIRRKHKDDKAKQSEETMRLYRESGINPASGCLPLLIQLPILIALYQVFFRGIGPQTYGLLYPFVPIPGSINFSFFSLALDHPSIILAVLAGIAQFIQVRFFAPAQSAAAPGQSDDTAAAMASMQKNMAYIFPIMTIFIGLRLPGALALYWVTSTLFGVLQQYLVKRSFHLTSNIPTM
jgi:YidC/Oxa1 family membrane protein insertase